MLKSHYAPSKPVVIGNLFNLIKEYDINKAAILSFKEYYPQIDPARQVVLSEEGSVTEAAKNLICFF